MQRAPLGLSDAVRDAAARGTHLMVRGSGAWWPGTPTGATDVRVPTASAITRLDAGDLVATASAGLSLAAIESELAAAGAWLALDPPGPAGRTLGGALAAGGGGPLSAGFGPPRDQVLGLTFVAGNGEEVRTGGRVVKNVAGFDLAKLVVGGHGAFGIITAAHLRLRALPAADRTRCWSGSLTAVAEAAATALADGAAPAAMEIVSPAVARAMGGDDAWSLLVRAMGTLAGAEEELEACARAARALSAARAAGGSDWTAWRACVGGWPVVVRIGADPSTWRVAVQAAERHLGAPLGVSVTVPRGTVRIGHAMATAATIHALRRDAAARGWPVTLERADQPTRAAAGLWGALPDGARRLTERLRRVFDPSGVFEVPLWTD